MDAICMWMMLCALMISGTGHVRWSCCMWAYVCGGIRGGICVGSVVLGTVYVFRL